MKREALLDRLRSTPRWDVLVIGGGATGLGCAVDAAARGHRTLLRARGITATIPEPADQIANRKRRGSAGGRPPAFDAEDYKNRNHVERSFNHGKQWRGFATRYDKLGIVYRGAAVLNAIIRWLQRLRDTP